MKKTEDQAKKKKMQLVATFGAVTLIALGALAVGMFDTKDGKTPNRVDLNATPTPGISQPTQTAKQETKEPEATVLPTVSPMDTKPEQSVTVPTPDASKPETENTQVAEINASEEIGTPVLSMDGVLDKLSFSAETGMLWPITGEALISFSPDHAIYHKTLDSYRTSNYVLLGSEVGTHVAAATDGVVTAVSEELRTGTTVTMQVSPTHEIVYGMLSDVTVQEGDYVDAGTVFASVAEPTRYFTEEGSGVYLQVLEENEPINPMLFLK